MSYPAQLVEFCSRLNAHQLAVVNFGAGQCCVSGVPGSGKSTSLVARIGRLISDGVPPSSIMAMTFTRSAAADMNEKLRLLGITGVKVGTIHAISLAIVAAETSLLHRTHVDDTSRLKLELKKLVGSFLRRRPQYRASIDYGALESFIEAAKASGPCFVAGDAFGMNLRSDAFVLDIARKRAPLIGLPAEVARMLLLEYEEKRNAAGLLDFSDMLLWAWLALASNYEARNRWRKKWEVVIVDEAQDSCAIQWDLARLLTGLPSCILPELTGDEALHNLMAAADIAQSIYAWRAAVPDLLLQYAKASDVESLILPISYRSTKRICALASHLIKGKIWNLTGEIQPARDELGINSVTWTEHATPADEATYVVEECLKYATNSPKGLAACAVLSRLRLGLDLVELECIRRRIPYIKRASGSIVTSPEVLDLNNYLRVACGLDTDNTILSAIINRPFRYIGKDFIVATRNLAATNGRPMLDILEREASFSLHRLQIEAMRKFVRLLNRLKRGIEEGDGPALLLRTVVDETDYMRQIALDKGLRGLDESMIAIIGSLFLMAASFPTTVEYLAYFDQLTLAVTQAERTGLKCADKAGINSLVLSTIHSAKGLEYDHVFVSDVVQGHLPCLFGSSLDEELRLLYVAITRASESCNLSYSVIDGTDSSCSDVIAQDAETSRSQLDMSRSQFLDTIISFLRNN